MVIWNRQEKNWWLLYTHAARQRRWSRRRVGARLRYRRGALTDDGHSWRYLELLPGLEYERGRNTFWAPEIIWHPGTYHMYASYVHDCCVGQLQPASERSSDVPSSR